ncbi:SLAC1 family transporter [Pseudomonas sp. S2_H01]
MCCPFRLSWWAVSFPSAGAAVCALRYAQHTSNMFTDSVAIVLLIGVTLLLFVMTLKTLANLARGNLKHLVG